MKPIYAGLMLGCAVMAGSSLFAQTRARVSPALVFTHAHVLDGTGRSYDDASVVVRDGRIVSVGAAPADLPRGATRIDARGMTVLPGYIDTHKHVMDGDGVKYLQETAARNMQDYLDAGFTTLQSCGDPLEPIVELRRRLASGEVRGPRLFTSGRVPLARGTPTTPGVDPARTDVSRPPLRPTAPAMGIPEAETRAAVQRLAAAGVDAIKTVMLTTPGGPEIGTLSVVVDEAKKHGLRTLTHAVTTVDMVAAIEGGTTVLVHTPHIGWVNETQGAQRAAAAGIPVLSTLGIFVPAFNEAEPAFFRDNQAYPEEHLWSAGQGPVNGRLLALAGVTYAFGTDTRFAPRFALWHELRPLQLMFSNSDIVKILTRNAALSLGKGAELGTIEAGKIADLVMVGGDPLKGAHHLMDVRLVVKDGVIVSDQRKAH